jgi:hypothetical protein
MGTDTLVESLSEDEPTATQDDQDQEDNNNNMISPRESEHTHIEVENDAHVDDKTAVQSLSDAEIKDGVEEISTLTPDADTNSDETQANADGNTHSDETDEIQADPVNDDGVEELRPFTADDQVSPETEAEDEAGHNNGDETHATSRDAAEVHAPDQDTKESDDHVHDDETRTPMHDAADISGKNSDDDGVEAADPPQVRDMSRDHHAPTEEGVNEEGLGGSDVDEGMQDGNSLPDDDVEKEGSAHAHAHAHADTNEDEDLVTNVDGGDASNEDSKGQAGRHVSVDATDRHGPAAVAIQKRARGMNDRKRVSELRAKGELPAQRREVHRKVCCCVCACVR